MLIYFFTNSKVSYLNLPTQGVGWVGWALGLKVLVLGSTGCALQFESCYLHFEKNFLGQRFTLSWAHPARTVISFWLKVLRIHCARAKKKRPFNGIVLEISPLTGAKNISWSISKTTGILPLLPFLYFICLLCWPKVKGNKL